MSVVAVKKFEDKIVISADSARINGWTQEKNKRAKLFQVNDITVGGAGSCTELGLLHLFCSTHKPSSASELGLMHFFGEFVTWFRDKTSHNSHELSNELIIVFDKKVFLFQSFFIREIEDFWAVGAGSDFALTALHLGHSPEKAVEVACELSIACEQPINTMEVKL